jgi:hypothetical protein
MRKQPLESLRLNNPRWKLLRICDSNSFLELPSSIIRSHRINVISSTDSNYIHRGGVWSYFREVIYRAIRLPIDEQFTREDRRCGPHRLL